MTPNTAPIIGPPTIKERNNFHPNAVKPEKLKDDITILNES